MSNYPHALTSVIDNSPAAIRPVEAMPLATTVIPINAERGPANVPMWMNSFTDVEDTYGKKTFDKQSPLFSLPSLFIQAICQAHGLFVVRLVPTDAKKASLVIEAHVKNKDVVQYEKDKDGRRVMKDGKPVPQKDGMSQNVTAPGVSVQFITRPLGDKEQIDSLQTQTVQNEDGSETTIYPMRAYEATSEGAYGNRLGFRLFYDRIHEDTTLRDTIHSPMYTFKPLEKEYGNDIETAVRTKFRADESFFTLKPNQINPATTKRISEKNVLADDYNGLPFVVASYDTSALATRIFDLEDAVNDKLVDNMDVNVLSFIHSDGVAYDAVEPLLDDADAIAFDMYQSIFLKGGTDGTNDHDAFEAMVQQFYEMKLYPDLEDTARYPLTHIYDMGYSQDTKESLIAFMQKQKKCVVYVSTQDVSAPMNTCAQDFASGVSLEARAMLVPESQVHGTRAIRACIMAHSGYLHTGYDKLVPLTYWAAMYNAKHYGQSIISAGKIGGSEDTYVDIFKEINWTAVGDIKAEFIKHNLNYVEYFDRKNYFFPILQSVYPNDNSTLSDMCSVNVICFIKYIVDRVWSKRVGVEETASESVARLNKLVRKEVEKLVNGRYNMSVRAYEAVDGENATVSHVQVRFKDNPNMRDLLCDIVAEHESTK